MRPLTEILEQIQAVIAERCAKCGRNPDEVKILGVTKTFGPEVVREAWEAGIAVCAENKVQEAAWKIPECPSQLSWHLIGHLQRNKVRAAVELFQMIHSVDSVRLLETIESCAEESGARPEILLEVNTSGESSKFGLKPEQVPEVIERAMECRNVTLSGFMTMAPFATEMESARPFFRRLRELRDEMESLYGIGLPELSMGMSGDYPVAVEEGATFVRLGTVLFGERPKFKILRASDDDEI